jgi:hypothetical protein
MTNRRISPAEQQRRYEEAMERERRLMPQPAASMNRVGSPTGRVERDAPDTSRQAAARTRAPAHRAIVLAALDHVGDAGMTSIEVAAILPLTRQGGPQVSNRAASRLGELWEAGQAYIVRERGHCTIGACHPHRKPTIIHKPSAPCETHGKPLTRDGAAIWRAYPPTSVREPVATPPRAREAEAHA